ncbi:MAG: GAF domain-containing protein, partial [Thermodesulfobacteriota bacterium]
PDTEKSDSWVDQKLLKEGIRSSLVYPLDYKGKVFGTLNFGNKKPNHFSNYHIDFLHSVAPSLAISIQNALLFEETIIRLHELTVLYEVMKISASSLNLNQMLKVVINSLNHLFKFERLGILLVDDKTKRLIPHPASYNEVSIDEIERLGLSVGRGITGWVAEKGEPLLVNDVTRDSRYICGDESIRSEMCAPLKVGQKVIGVIDAQSTVLNGFTEDDFRLFNIIGGQLATLIENMRLYERVRQSEENYRKVVEGAHDGICVIGMDNRLGFVNQKMEEIFGYPKEELVGMDFRDLINEESRRFIEERTTRRQRGKKLSPVFELKGVRKDGEVIDLEINAKVLKASEGEINYIVFVKDTTEKKRMEQQLLQSEKLRALGEMASGVAHDFNNALAAILGNAQLMLITAKDEEMKESLRTIEKVAKDAAHTVRRLQEFTKKKTHQELFRLDVNQIIRDTIEITRPKWKDEAQARGLTIEVVSNLEEIPTVAGNASDLREVITNMIFNAIEAMPEGGKIEIRTFHQKQNVYIQISDTGIGMEEEVRKKIFEPFFTTKPFSNTGLGLSMSYGIIRRFGGEIEVESKVGLGTTFTISLPIELEGKEEKVSLETIQKGKEARILIIDDEETVRDALSKILSQVHHEVTLAHEGEEGIRLFRENKFDIVLTDLGMPGLSGWEVCREIKKLSPQTPVGMITGWGAQLSEEEIEEHHIDFLISKPFDFYQIIKVVNETMASRGDQILS